MLDQYAKITRVGSYPKRWWNEEVAEARMIRAKDKKKYGEIFLLKKSFDKHEITTTISFIKQKGHAGRIFCKEQMMRSTPKLSYMTKTAVGRFYAALRDLVTGNDITLKQIFF